VNRGISFLRKTDSPLKPDLMQAKKQRFANGLFCAGFRPLRAVVTNPKEHITHD